MTLDARGYPFDHAEAGSGPTIVFVHGSMSDRRTWSGQLPRFAGEYRAVAYSRRYHWPHPKVAAGEDYTMPVHVDDLVAIVESLGVGAVHLVGHSYGGFATLLAAMARPELVRSLVLIEPPVLTLLTSDPPRPLQLLKLLVRRPATAVAIVKLGATGLGPAKAAAARGDDEVALTRVGRAVLGRRAFAELSPARLQVARDNYIPAELTGPGFPRLSADAVRSLDRPVLLLTGQRSPRVFAHLARHLGELLPHAQRAEIPDASHNVHEDAPAAFAEQVLTFLSAT